MTVTVDVEADPNVRLTDVDVGAVPPDTIEFAIEGKATVSSDLLGAFEGRSLRPATVEIVAEGTTVVVDLEEAVLRLETVDVGVAAPDAEDVPRVDDALGSLPNGAPESLDDVDAGTVAFSLEGTITGAARDVVEALSGRPTTVESITFAVDEPLANDGGSGDDVVLELPLLGFVIAILRDGTITIRRA